MRLMGLTHIQDLSAKVVEKIRDWILAKTSLANNQSLQQLRKVQKPLSKYGALFSFLAPCHEAYAKEVWKRKMQLGFCFCLFGWLIVFGLYCDAFLLAVSCFLFLSFFFIIIVSDFVVIPSLF
jgi:hypothetical protein